MYQALLAFSKWLEGTWWGTDIRTSLWVYPFIQLIHFTGLSLWLATCVSVDLRLLGAGKSRQTAEELSNAVFAWNWIGFLIVVFGGFLLFSSTGRGYAQNPAFQVKLGIFVPLGLIWHIVVQQKVHTWGKTKDTPAVAKFAGLLEILLWLCVVTAAVEIPNY
jgi:hypothetical protein